MLKTWNYCERYLKSLITPAMFQLIILLNFTGENPKFLKRINIYIPTILIDDKWGNHRIILE